MVSGSRASAWRRSPIVRGRASRWATPRRRRTPRVTVCTRGSRVGETSPAAPCTTEIDASRLLIWRAAWLAKNGQFKNGEGSMSKWKASETAVRVTEEAIQILGGYGYTREYIVEKIKRDVRITTIYEGTSEIQRLVISRYIGV